MFVSLGESFGFLQARDAPVTSESTPWLLACVIFFATCAAWGVSNVQLFLYVLRHVNDPWKLKALALSIWTLDTLHQALVTYRNPVIPIGANFIPFSLQDIVFDAVCDLIAYAMSWLSSQQLPFLPFALVSVLGQSFFAYQCGTVSKRPYLIPACAAPLILFQLVLPIVQLSDIQRSILNYQDELTDETAGWLVRINGILHLHNNLLLATVAIGAALNILMTGFLITFLWRGYVRHGSAFQRPRPFFFRVVLLFTNTGLCTAIYSFLTIFMIAYTRVVYDLFGVYVKLLAPLYTCSVLANLNARDYLTAQGDHVFLPINSESKESMLSSMNGPIRFRERRTFDTELPSTT